MSLGYIVSIVLNGLANASTLFLLAAGLSLIFGVSRIVNFAHGSFYMLGAYLAYSLINLAGPGIFGLICGVVGAALILGLLGALIELVLLRRLYAVPELFQLLATFGLALLISDVALSTWGPESLLGPRIHGLDGSLNIFGRNIPAYDFVIIATGPVVFGCLWWLLNRTYWGMLVRAATEDRDMVSALGINHSVLFTAVFALGTLLAGLGGALQIPRSPADLTLDVTAISDAFVVVVVGGMGSIPGALLAAVIVGMARAICLGVGTISFLSFDISLAKLALVVEFIVMAVVLIFKPRGLLGRPESRVRMSLRSKQSESPSSSGMAPVTAVFFVLLAFAPLLHQPYALVFLIDVLLTGAFVLSLYFILGPGGMVSFGHAAYFGLGAYGAALLFKTAGWPMEAALLGAPIVGALGGALFGWFSVRLSGVYLAMLTLAFAQIVWSVVFQWDGLTGGSNGFVGIWPAPWLASRTAMFYFALVFCAATAFSLYLVNRSPFGMMLRAARDSALRAETLGINRINVQWSAFIIASAFAGLAGGIFAFSKGSLSADVIGISRSIDGLVMVILGGMQSILGPLAGAVLFNWLQDNVMRYTDFWRGLLGLTIILITLFFPNGIVGLLRSFRVRRAS
jgi:branched-chain amino acid transport system permease protein